jgi:hypothetical protein
MKRMKRSMQSPPILRTRNKRFFIGLRLGVSGWSSGMAVWCQTMVDEELTIQSTSGVAALRIAGS